MWLFVGISDWLQGILHEQLNFWGWEYLIDDLEIASSARTTLYLIYYLLIALKGKNPFIFAYLDASLRWCFPLKI